MRGQRASGRLRRYRPNARVALAGAGVLSACAGTALAAQIGVFYFHSSRAGGDLIRQERQAIARAAARPGACQAPRGGAAGATASSAPPAPGRQRPDGLLEAPALGLVAPVLQGTSDSVLSDAVGHDPASAWPGQQGTSVLSAHDVTWFSRIAQLRLGSQIRYVTPCWTYTYAVTSHAVVKAGTPVYTTNAARLVLDTCYPLNALYLTSTRYLLYASLAGSAPTHAMAAVPGQWPAPAVPAPAALAAEGLTLARNSAPLGTLRLAGTPARAWVQSSAPLRFEAAALAAYFGAIRTAAQEKKAWWADLAPAVPARAAGALWGGHLHSYRSLLTVTLRASGARAVAARLAATVTVSGPHGSGRYRLTVRETASGGKLLVTGILLTPAGKPARPGDGGALRPRRASPSRSAGWRARGAQGHSRRG